MSLYHLRGIVRYGNYFEQSVQGQTCPRDRMFLFNSEENDNMRICYPTF